MADTSRSQERRGFHITRCHGRRGVDLQGSQAASLCYDGGTIEHGGHDAVEVIDDWGPVCKLELLWDHCPPQAHPSEAGVLAEGARLHAALLGSCITHVEGFTLGSPAGVQLLSQLFPGSPKTGPAESILKVCQFAIPS